MTAPDPRLDEIQARLSAATPGPWAFDGTEIDTAPDPEGDTPWKSIMECRVDCMSYCYGGSVAMDIGADDRALIQSAPADLAYLLAELRKAHEALARAEALADEWESGYGPSTRKAPSAPLLLLRTGTGCERPDRPVRSA